jgi:four helix bundle protein
MSFENLKVWKRSARLSATLYQRTKELRDFGFRDQLTRSGLSIPSNIAEGYERDSDAEIARFLTIAKGSAGELRTQILIGIEAGYLDRATALAWADEAKQLGKMLGALINRHSRQKPPRETDFGIPPDEYLRGIYQCETCKVYFSRHDMLNGDLYASRYNEATYQRDLLTTFNRIRALPEAESDNKQRVNRVIRFHETKGTGPICAQHPSGRPGKLDQSPFSPIQSDTTNNVFVITDPTRAISTTISGASGSVWSRSPLGVKPAPTGQGRLLKKLENAPGSSKGSLRFLLQKRHPETAPRITSHLRTPTSSHRVTRHRRSTLRNTVERQSDASSRSETADQQ